MITKPKPERSARISMTLSVAANSRMDTAIAENESNAPVIHRTTRMRWLEVTLEPSLERSIARGSDRRASLRVGLILRPRPFEGRKPQAGRIDSDELGKLIQRHFQTPCVVDLWHQANIGERHCAAERIGARTHHRLQCLET